jgi:hypothetical protein
MSLCVACGLQKRAIVSRFQIVTAIVMKMQVLCGVTLCPWVSVAGVTKVRNALKRREPLPQGHDLIFLNI